MLPASTFLPCVFVTVAVSVFGPYATVLHAAPHVLGNAYALQTVARKVSVQLQNLILCNQLGTVIGDAIPRLDLVFDVFYRLPVHYPATNNTFELRVQPRRQGFDERRVLADPSFCKRFQERFAPKDIHAQQRRRRGSGHYRRKRQSGIRFHNQLELTFVELADRVELTGQSSDHTTQRAKRQAHELRHQCVKRVNPSISPRLDFVLDLNVVDAGQQDAIHVRLQLPGVAQQKARVFAFLAVRIVEGCFLRHCQQLAEVWSSRVP